MKCVFSVFLVFSVIVLPYCTEDFSCTDDIDVDRINKMTITSQHVFSLTGSGTMPGTGSGTMSPCTGSGSIAGSIYTQYNQPIRSVHVELQSTQDNYPIHVDTGGNGDYAFSLIENEFNYNIRPRKEGNYLNGISTTDVVLLANMIFRTDYRLSPYAYIAADINQDQKLDINDIIELLYLIIGRTTELEDNWVFVDAQMQFIDEANPWPFMAEINVNNLQGSSLNNDFIGIKVGDISGNANPSLPSIAQPRDDDHAALYVEDIYLNEHEVHTINFYSPDLHELKGMQLFLTHAGLDILTVNSGILDADKAAYQHTDETLFFSWYGVTESQADVLFSIDVRTNQPGYLSDLLANFDNWLPTEAYTGDELNATSLDLIFIENGFELPSLMLGQNSPNPFLDQTEITFSLSQEGDVRLDVYDNTGRMYLQKTHQGQVGANTIVIQAEQLSNSGLYYYSLSYKGDIQTKSMLLIE